MKSRSNVKSRCSTKYLEVFAEYSTLHTKSEKLIFGAIDSVYGVDATVALEDAHYASMFGDTDRAQASTSNFWTSVSIAGAGIVVGGIELTAPIDPATYHYSQSPGPGWIWEGSPELGQWHNRTTGESLRADLNLSSRHFIRNGEIHFDWKTGWGDLKIRLYPSGLYDVDW